MGAGKVNHTSLLRGLQLSIPLELQDLIVESGSLMMVQAIQGKKESIAMLSNLTKGIQELMKRFPKCHIQHVGRLGNNAAHKLARNAWNVEDINVWWESYPDFLSQIIWTF